MKKNFLGRLIIKAVAVVMLTLSVMGLAVGCDFSGGSSSGGGTTPTPTPKPPIVVQVKEKMQTPTNVVYDKTGLVCWDCDNVQDFNVKVLRYGMPKDYEVSSNNFQIPNFGVEVDYDISVQAKAKQDTETVDYEDSDFSDIATADFNVYNLLTPIGLKWSKDGILTFTGDKNAVAYQIVIDGKQIEIAADSQNVTYQIPNFDVFKDYNIKAKSLAPAEQGKDVFRESNFSVEASRDHEKPLTDQQIYTNAVKKIEDKLVNDWLICQGDFIKDNVIVRSINAFDVTNDKMQMFVVTKDYKGTVHNNILTCTLAGTGSVTDLGSFVKAADAISETWAGDVKKDCIYVQERELFDGFVKLDAAKKDPKLSAIFAGGKTIDEKLMEYSVFPSESTGVGGVVKLSDGKFYHIRYAVKNSIYYWDEPNNYVIDIYNNAKTVSLGFGYGDLLLNAEVFNTFLKEFGSGLTKK